MEMLMSVQIKCVGQRSASELISKLSPSSVSPSGTILVNDHLQIMNIESSNLYALGDVAETDALKMGRSASLQAPIVCENIVRSIKGQSLVKYHSSIIDRSIELTLGLVSGLFALYGLNILTCIYIEDKCLISQ